MLAVRGSGRAFGFLVTFHENTRPGTIAVYLATSDATAAQKALSGKGVKVNEVKDELFGPGSGAKWFNLEDPEGNQVLLVQAYVCEHLFCDSSRGRKASL